MILDTNALSAFADGDESLAEKLGNVAELALPVIVLGEYRFGIRASRYRKDYEAWLHRHLELFDVLEIDLETTAHYAEMRHQLKQAGHPIPENDLWIAALSRQHSLPVVSRDSHFRSLPGVHWVGW